MKLRQTIEDAINRRKVPPFDRNSITSIASALGLPLPISLKTLLDRLDTLPFATATFSSGPLTANYVHGWAQLGLQSDGLTSFRGHVHESGEAGDNYLLVAALLDVKDDSGKTPVFVRTGNVAGQLQILQKSDDDWQTDRAVELIRAQWDIAKTSRVEWRLHASTDPIQVLSFIAGEFVPGSGIVIGLLLESGPGGDKGDGTSCDWTSDALHGCEKH